MNRRTFLGSIAVGVGTRGLRPVRAAPTLHAIFLCSGGVRKQDYYDNAALCPNLHRLANQARVYLEDHCERIASHDAAFEELLRGRPFDSDAVAYPTVLDYIGSGIQLDRIQDIPQILERHGPRLIVCRDLSLDVGHYCYESYLAAVKTTDAAVGELFDWVSRHPTFFRTTAIVFRPEFGRDDVVNDHGQLHHSYGFYSTHRVASIFWGPDFNRGIDRETVISSLDMAPTLAKLFNVDAIHAQGRVIPGLFLSR